MIQGTQGQLHPFPNTRGFGNARYPGWDASRGSVSLAERVPLTLAKIFTLLDQLGLPPLTMPFILACWAVTLGQRQYQRQGELQPS